LIWFFVEHKMKLDSAHEFYIKPYNHEKPGRATKQPGALGFMVPKAMVSPTLPVNPERSANVELDCVNRSFADYDELHRDWAIFGQRMEKHKQNLETPRRVMEGFIQDIRPQAQCWIH
jgi:hypothetical protein